MHLTINLRELLTPRQLQLLKTIASFEMNQCYSPTIGELASELGISRSTVFEHIKKLREKGLLSAFQGKARSLKLTYKSQELLSSLNEQKLNNSPSLSTDIALVGRIAAGVPIEAIEDKKQLSFINQFGNSDELFALEVKGDSMIEDDIRDGDYVICQRSCTANNGELVVAIVEAENATLKRFYKEESCARLQPANDKYQPIYSDNCRIEGIVVGLIRKL